MEGCATFTRSAVLEVVRRVDLPLKNVLREVNTWQCLLLIIFINEP